MKRFAKRLPGHDCVRRPCGRNGCGRRAGANHGIASETWIYAVSNGEVAMSIRVSSSVFPESVPYLPTQSCRLPRGTVMHEHHAFPVCEAHVLGEAEKCEYLDAGACFSGEGSSLAADDFFDKHGTSDFAQPESFWLELEAELKKRSVQLQADRVDGKLAKCSCCGGAGIVSVGGEGESFVVELRNDTDHAKQISRVIRGGPNNGAGR